MNCANCGEPLPPPNYWRHLSVDDCIATLKAQVATARDELYALRGAKLGVARALEIETAEVVKTKADLAAAQAVLQAWKAWASEPHMLAQALLARTRTVLKEKHDVDDCDFGGSYHYKSTKGGACSCICHHQGNK